RRLTGALQADHHHDRWRADEREADFVAAEERLQLVADDLCDLLRGREGGQDILTDGLFANAGGELFDDFEVDVRLEQSNADLLERVVDMPLIEAGFAA